MVLIVLITVFLKTYGPVVLRMMKNDRHDDQAPRHGSNAHGQELHQQR